MSLQFAAGPVLALGTSKTLKPDLIPSILSKDRVTEGSGGHDYAENMEVESDGASEPKPRIKELAVLVHVRRIEV